MDTTGSIELTGICSHCGGHMTFDAGVWECNDCFCDEVVVDAFVVAIFGAETYSEGPADYLNMTTKS
jgi:hypothetical protein